MLNAILPLVNLDGSMYAACSYIRKMASSPGTGITSAAMTAACVIVLFTMIKLSHDLMSDEQQSGFGGVTLWQICRPIVILLAIFNFNPIDSVVNGVELSSGAVRNHEPAIMEKAFEIVGYGKEVIEKKFSPYAIITSIIFFGVILS